MVQTFTKTLHQTTAHLSDKKSDDSNSIGSMAFKHVKDYGDGRCLFRCIATLLN